MLFIDRDGTLIEEPADEQVDSLREAPLMPGVIPALLELRDAGLRFVHGQQPGRARHAVFPGSQLSRAAGVPARAARIPGHPLRCGVRLPAPCGGRLRLPQADESDCCGITCASARSIVAHSYVIGDRDTDLELAANLGIRAARASPGQRRGNLGRDRATAREAAHARPGSTARPRRPTSRSRSTSTARRRSSIATGIGFFDHMLEQVAQARRLLRSSSRARGDLDIDEHHTVEDCALALGQALREALGDKRGIARYGFLLPMDEAQAQVAHRSVGPRLLRVRRQVRARGGRRAADRAGAALLPLAGGEPRGGDSHQRQGENTHHMIEACFKGVGRALRQAVRRRGHELPSTKGVL